PSKNAAMRPRHHARPHPPFCRSDVSRDRDNRTARRRDSRRSYSRSNIRGNPMAEITASLVKELRERTGAGMMECKKALTENNGDVEASAEWLRKQGLAKADKKASRIAAEGRIAAA